MSDYKSFFKNAQKARSGGRDNSGNTLRESNTETLNRQYKKSNSENGGHKRELDDLLAEMFHRKSDGSKSKRKNSSRASGVGKKRARQTGKKKYEGSVQVIGITTVLVLGWGLFLQSDFERWMNQVEISLFQTLGAAEKSAESKVPKEEKVSTKESLDERSELVGSKGPVSEDLSHFANLRERKIELDLREQELNELEEELHKQKNEIEARILKLEEIRNEIEGVLKNRVEVDQKKVETLVSFYSNMKPEQAAELLGKINEDLAVEVFGRMKKKDAASILNLLEPQKARALSEKFAGYKRK